MPHSSGVYIFKDKNKYPLYIGKSINLNKRVKSHFSRKNIYEKRLYSQVKNIEVIETAGELGALIKESNLIKRLQPVYNKKLRKKKKLVAIKEKHNNEGYKTAEVEVTSNENIELKNIIAVCKSIRKAKELLNEKAEEYHLCQKLLGLHNTKKACFYYHLNFCFGACIKKEGVEKYNQRFDKAFFKTKINCWPYKGPIKITESNKKLKDEFIINNWCIKTGSYYKNSKKTSTIYQRGFTLNTYKILSKFVLNNKIKVKVL